MAQLSKEQRVFVVKTYFETKKFTEVRNLFRQRYPDRNPPNKTTIWKNVKKYETHATSLNRNELKRNRNFVRRAVRDMVKRANLCIERAGGHVEGKFR